VVAGGARRNALDLAEQEKSTFPYQYSVFQMESSRNLLFRSGRQMEEIFQSLIDGTRAPLDLDRIKTIFGDKNCPHYDKRKKNIPSPDCRGNCSPAIADGYDPIRRRCAPGVRHPHIRNRDGSWSSGID
jgi:hypothetical protein